MTDFNDKEVKSSPIQSKSSPSLKKDGKPGISEDKCKVWMKSEVNDEQGVNKWVHVTDGVMQTGDLDDKEYEVIKKARRDFAGSVKSATYQYQSC